MTGIAPGDRRVVASGEKPVVVAVVNNAGDGGLLATERQFCSIFNAASVGVTVQLKFYAISGRPRSTQIQAHIDQYYEPIESLFAEAPDGIIVTGMEPQAARLDEEPFWPHFAALVDFVERADIPAIWSCLAAHAAVFCMDGIERRRLPKKLCGVFECASVLPAHRILNGLPRRWSVPHSRFYGLPEAPLLAQGYSILSRSREAGVDMFIKRGGAPQLFLQGHSEYGPSALLGEYRRDVARFMAGERHEYPGLPLHYLSQRQARELIRLRASAANLDAISAMAALDAVLSSVRCADTWSAIARRIYVNWLGEVMLPRMRRRPYAMSRQVATTREDADAGTRQMATAGND